MSNLQQSQNMVQTAPGMKLSRSSLWLGIWLIALSIALFWVFHPVSTPIPQTSGHIQVAAEHALGGRTNVIVLQFMNSNDVYIANPKNFTPALPTQLAPGTHVDLYYQDGTPRQIIALQLYNASGQPTTKYITATYAAMQPQLLSWRTIIPGLLALLGLLLAGRTLWLQRKQQQLVATAS